MPLWLEGFSATLLKQTVHSEPPFHRPRLRTSQRAADAIVAYYSSSNEQLSASQLVPAADPLHHIPPRQAT